MALCSYGGCVKRHERVNAFNLVINYDVGGRLVERLSTHGSIDSGSKWHESTLTGDSTTAVTEYGRRTPRVAYRLICDAGYYGRRCSLSCNARHDKFGHYVCADNGTRICLDGWTGSFCDARTYI